MSQAVSPSAHHPFGLARVCRVWQMARSTVYARRHRAVTVAAGWTPKKRGPKTRWKDATVLERIREVLKTSTWVGEGHRKVWAKLRQADMRVGKPRVLRLMREAGLLAPTRVGRRHGPKAHDGSIIPATPDTLWGTDLTTTLTGEGTVGIFAVLDHCTAECLGIHAARPATRFEALEPVHQAVIEVFGAVAPGIAANSGLAVRHDHGSQYMSDVFQTELHFLGIATTPSFVGEPQGNGCIERFFRTLKEQLLWLQCYDTVADLQAALQAFKVRYNHEWQLERHGYRSPSEQRRLLTDSQERAA